MFNMKNGSVPIYFIVFGQPLRSLSKVSSLVNSQNKFFTQNLKILNLWGWHKRGFGLKLPIRQISIYLK